MKPGIFFALFAIMFMLNSACSRRQAGTVTIDTHVLKDKIAGGWAGKMLGVSYGGPTEFVAHGFILEDTISWTPSKVNFSLMEDDIYVQLTFMMTMDQFGIDAPAKKFQELFAKSGYKLWHANVQARKNYFDSIFPPLSGHPDYNAHADDIDFQIEADYIGFICPGMPATANRIADKIGHIMNYGDGVYGGMFVAALYSAAFFDNDILNIIRTALLSLPEESAYSRIIRDVILLYQAYPDNWREAWHELEHKWADTDICGAGSTYNIDAKFNGAYIAMGLLYGGGDPFRTMDIATRCGQDSDCNPSNAMAVLGVIKGFSGLPQEYQDAVTAIGDSVFIHTDYSFNKAVEQSVKYAKELTVQNGGRISGDKLFIKVQNHEPVIPEDAFPGLEFAERVSVFGSDNWQFTGNWQIHKKGSGENQSMVSMVAGNMAEFTFEGTAVFIAGNWYRDCGKADIYVDGEFRRTIDAFYNYSGQQPSNEKLIPILNLPEGKHTVRIVVKGEKRPESEGTQIYLTEATVFRPGEKINDNHKFSFQQ